MKQDQTTDAKSAIGKSKNGREMKSSSVWTALRNKPFCGLWIASLVSGSAVSAHNLAAMSALSSLGSSKFFISLVPALASLAFFLFTLPAGHVADAFNRRGVMICANLWLFTMAGGLGVLAFLNRISPVAILSTVFLAGVGFAVNAPSWTASIPEIVDDDELASAVILGGIQLNISGLVGSAVGGVLTHLFGPGVVFIINGLGFLLVVAALVAWKAGSNERVTRRTEISRAGPTMSDLTKIPSAVKAVWMRSVLFSISVAAVPALIPVLCLKEICVDSSRLGFTLASVAFGSIAGAVWVLPSLRRRFSSDEILRIAFTILALSFLGLAFIPMAPVFLLLCAFSGSSWSIAGSELWVIAQRAATNSIRGRANAILLMVSQGALALGATVLGAIATHVGTSTAFSLAAIFLLIVACLPNVFGITVSTEPPPTYDAMH